MANLAEVAGEQVTDPQKQWLQQACTELYLEEQRTENLQRCCCSRNGFSTTAFPLRPGQKQIGLILLIMSWGLPFRPKNVARGGTG